METKTIIAAAAGLAFGAGLGATVWWSTRIRRGHIYRVSGRYYADQALVDELAKRLPGASRSGSGRGEARPAHVGGPPSSVVEIYLYKSGKLSFRRVDGEILPAGTRLPDQVGEALYVLEWLGTATILEDFAVLLVQYGLAESGGAYSSWPTQSRDGVLPRPEKLHDTAFDPKYAFSWGAPPVEITRKMRPRGHYFVVAGDYFADEAMLTSLEWFHGTDYIQGRVVVPAWKRGSIQLAAHSGFHRFPEQEGALYTITPLLDQVTLDDFLVELEHYNLVSWGGEWPDLETDAETRKLRGRALPMNPEGHVVRLGTEVFLDEAALDVMTTRLSTSRGPGALYVQWRGSALRISHVTDGPRFREQRGKLYSLGGGRSAATDSLVAALQLHRLVSDLLVFQRWPWRDRDGRWFQ